MKFKIFTILLIVCLMFSACKKEGEVSNPASNNKSDTEKNSEEQKTAILYTNMEGGSDSPNIKQHEWKYTGELTAEKLAEGLSELTGLDFKITADVVKDSITIDWKNDSTLIANLGDKEQKEEFFLFDVDSMRWFMMDSLWVTLTKNLKVEDVFYTMDGGKSLKFEELYAANEFPTDIPYMGAAFYFAHVDGKGDDIDDGRGDLIDMSDQPYVGFWNSTNKIDEDNNSGYGKRYALYADGTFIYADDEIGQLREVFKTGTWIIDAESTLVLNVEARWVIPVGDIDDLEPSDDQVILKEAGLVKVMYGEPETEQYSISEADADAETGKSAIIIDRITYYDFNESDEFFKDFYDLPNE